MAHELTLSTGGIPALQAEKGVMDMIRPLQREIHLFDTYIAGTRQRHLFQADGRREAAGRKGRA